MIVASVRPRLRWFHLCRITIRVLRCAAVVTLLALTWISPASAQLNQPYHSDGWTLAAARAPGLNQATWRTDLWLNLTSSDSDAKVSLIFCESGADNSAAEVFELDIVEGEYVYYIEDVVEHFLGVGDSSWVGAIHYQAEATLVHSWARIYSISAEGDQSYGQLVEGIPTADMSPDTDPWNSEEHQRLFAMKHTEDGRFRVNIGIINPTSVTSTYEAQMYGPDGNSPSTGQAIRSVDVPAFSMVQLSDPFADVEGGEWSNMIVRVVCLTEGGGTFAYASVVDNATNDAFFVRAVKRMQVEPTP